MEQGNTVLVIEHNLDVIKSADYLIDMGPEGGEAGGRIVAAGTPEEVAANAESVTGRFIRQASMNTRWRRVKKKRASKKAVAA